MNDKKKVTELHETVEQEISNSNPIHDTQSEPNQLKKSVSIGRNPIEKRATHSSIEGLRPSASEITNG